MRADLGAPIPPAGGGLPSFDAEEPAFTPETTNQIPAIDQIVSEGGPKKPFWIIGAVAGFLVLAAVGYFVVAPMFNKTDTTTPVAPVVTNPVAPVTPIQPVAVHKTQFINPPVATVTEKLTAFFTKELLNGVLVKYGQTAPMGITEVIVVDPNGVPLNMQTILTTLAPTIDIFDIPADAPADNLTIFIYKDANGVWPGYIGSDFRPETTPTQMATFTKKIEAGALKNFFIVAPGTLSPFKNGTINNIPDRYAPGTTAGASLGYLVKNNKLLISTSFTGMKEALRLMGL